jgi:hypothetical protein
MGAGPVAEPGTLTADLAAVPPDLAAVEARLQAILDPYRDRLEAATIYGIPMLRRPGATAHDWFAFVKPATKHVSFFLLPVHGRPELAESMSPVLLRHWTGKSTFTFKDADEVAMTELDALVARAFVVYMA